MESSNKSLREVFHQTLQDLMLDDALMEDLDRVYMPMANMIRMGFNTGERTRIIGVNGAQGAGKTTFGRLLQVVLEKSFGMKVVQLSIDDIYLSRSARERLAQEVHPLLATRGVPGTHDVKLGEDTLDALCEAGAKDVTLIPRFNKATDDPFPRTEWDSFVGRPDVVIFDGWFMGAVEQKETDLLQPVNALEREEDPYCVWRRYVNSQLKDNYKSLFNRLDLLVMLKVPSFDKVYEWRALQEEKLRIKTQGQKNLRVMSEEEVKRFISHYERLTRHILAEMPSRADMLFKVSEDHRICI
ncbi:MAG: hypothetical protein MJZ30_08480 [Paludibacteraceae bacterium]|nr:hypothetical protein [Paludibacteraceae bacterium]